MKKNIKKINYLFFLILPFIDLITGLVSRFIDLPISIGMIIKGLYILLIAIYILFYSKSNHKKKFIIYISLCVIFTLLYFITKTDLLNNNEEKEIKYIMSYYKKAGYKVITNKEIKEIKKLTKDKVVVFAGQSGAGKSTLLNKLDKTLLLETNEISKALGRGKHTTRCVTLYDIDGALIADTPGFSMIDFRGMTKLDIRDNMKEMYDNLEKCKYRDCMHIKEDDCYVKELVKNGKILKSRYENYKSFLGGK